jgi:hypothetical protein
VLILVRFEGKEKQGRRTRNLRDSENDRENLSRSAETAAEFTTRQFFERGRLAGLGRTFNCKTGETAGIF